MGFQDFILKNPDNQHSESFEDYKNNEGEILRSIFIKNDEELNKKKEEELNKKKNEMLEIKQKEKDRDMKEYGYDADKYINNIKSIIDDGKLRNIAINNQSHKIYDTQNEPTCKMFSFISRNNMLNQYKGVDIDYNFYDRGCDVYLKWFKVWTKKHQND